MNRSEFEAAARRQNEEAAARRAEARETAAPCVVVPMFAFNSEWCSAHGVMGPCPFGEAK